MLKMAIGCTTQLRNLSTLDKDYNMRLKKMSTLLMSVVNIELYLGLIKRRKTDDRRFNI